MKDVQEQLIMCFNGESANNIISVEMRRHRISQRFQHFQKLSANNNDKGNAFTQDVVLAGQCHMSLKTKS